jgi:hypothetical protein
MLELPPPFLIRNEHPTCVLVSFHLAVMQSFLFFFSFSKNEPGFLKESLKSHLWQL